MPLYAYLFHSLFWFLDIKTQGLFASTKSRFQGVLYSKQVDMHYNWKSFHMFCKYNSVPDFEICTQFSFNFNFDKILN